MFKHLIIINPLGTMYGSSGGFLSPENLVGISRRKFPPEAATLSGLFFLAAEEGGTKEFASHKELKGKLHVAGPFWAKLNDPYNFYVPIPWHKVIAKEETDEWHIEEGKWQRNQEEIEPDYKWQTIDSWDDSPDTILSNESASADPWKFTPILHPHLKPEERCSKSEDGLFLESAVQMPEDHCLVYLSTHKLPDGWYRFGGENHTVEVTSEPIDEGLTEQFDQPLGNAFTLITPGIWGSNRFSERYPQPLAQKAPTKGKPLMLTDKPIPYRYRLSGFMGRGRYAVAPGSVYVLEKALEESWWDLPEDWFPTEGISLKKMGCGLCLPVNIKGLDNV
ncbi:MAG: hypothetical protein WBG70_19565 [Spirulinaceae cyanobacterium]